MLSLFLWLLWFVIPGLIIVAIWKEKTTKEINFSFKLGMTAVVLIIWTAITAAINMGPRF